LRENLENIGKNDEETIENKEVIKIEEKKVEEEKVEKEDENKLDEKIPENLNKIKELIHLLMHKNQKN